MDKWEYKHVVITWGDEDAANKLGEDGWEIIQVMTNVVPGKEGLWLKRKISK